MENGLESPPPPLNPKFSAPNAAVASADLAAGPVSARLVGVARALDPVSAVWLVLSNAPVSPHAGRNNVPLGTPSFSSPR